MQEYPHAMSNQEISSYEITSLMVKKASAETSSDSAIAGVAVRRYKITVSCNQC